MLPTDKQEIFFRSRVCKLSRPFVDTDGAIRYEHNERLTSGERVITAGAEEVVVAKGGAIDLLSRTEMVDIFVTREGRTEERIQVPEDSVYRFLLAPARN